MTEITCPACSHAFKMEARSIIPDEQRLSLEITTETGYLCAKTLAGVISEFDKLNKAIAKDAGCKVETMIENFVRNGNALRIDFVILRASEGKNEGVK